MFINRKFLLLVLIPVNDKRKRDSSSSRLRDAIKGNNVLKSERRIYIRLPGEKKKQSQEPHHWGGWYMLNFFSLIHSIAFLEMFHSLKELINVCFLLKISGRWYSTTDGPKGCPENPVSSGKRHPKCQ